MAWCLIQPGPAVVWTALAGFTLAMILWSSEQRAVKRLRPRAPKPRFLVGGFGVVGGATWLAAGLAVILLVWQFGTLQLTGSGMSPTLATWKDQPATDRVRVGRMVRQAGVGRLPPGEACLGLIGLAVSLTPLAASRRKDHGFSAGRL